LDPIGNILLTRPSNGCQSCYALCSAVGKLMLRVSVFKSAVCLWVWDYSFFFVIWIFRNALQAWLQRCSYETSFQSNKVFKDVIIQLVVDYILSY